MSTIRQIDLDQDLPMLDAWWTAHKTVPVARPYLPNGWLVSVRGVPVAALFLYLDVNGKFAMVEYLTTNPECSSSRFLVDDVKLLVAYVEQKARDQGCVVITSMVVPGTGEERLYTRLGYVSGGDRPHQMWCKQLYMEESKCP